MITTHLLSKKIIQQNEKPWSIFEVTESIAKYFEDSRKNIRWSTFTPEAHALEHLYANSFILGPGKYSYKALGLTLKIELQKDEVMFSFKETQNPHGKSGIYLFKIDGDRKAKLVQVLFEKSN